MMATDDARCQALATQQLQRLLEAGLVHAERLQDALRHGRRREQEDAAADFNAGVVKGLGFTQWNADARKLYEKSTFLERLAKLEATLRRESAAVPAVGGTWSTAEAFAHASNGAALKGSYFGFAGPIAGVSKAILRAPSACNDPTACDAGECASRTFYSVADVKAFKAAVATSGWSAAVDAVPDREMPPQSSFVARMTYLCQPMASFSMMTPRLAVDTASVTDMASAKQFLLSYGSHVHIGRFELGGIFYKTADILAPNELLVNTLMAECPGLETDDLSIGYGGSDDACFAYTSFGPLVQAATTYCGGNTCSISTRIECLGPTTLSATLFRLRLKADASTWELIDRPATRVAVWTLVQDEKRCRHQGALLCAAWLDIVRSSTDESVRVARVQAYAELWALDPTFGGMMAPTPYYSGPVQSLRHALRSADAVAEFFGAFARTLQHDTYQIIWITRGFDVRWSKWSMEITLYTLRDARVQDALRRLVAATDVSALTGLGVLFDRVLFDVARTASPPVVLDASVTRALQEAARLAAIVKTPPPQDGAWAPPTVASNDVPAIISIVVQAALATAVPNHRLLTDRLGAILTRNLSLPPRSRKKKALYGVACRFGFVAGCGFLSVLTATHIAAMVDAMKAALVARTPTTPAPPTVVSARSSDDGHPLCHLLAVSHRPTDVASRISFALQHRLSLVKELYGDKTDKQSTPDTNDVPRVDALLDRMASLAPTARADVLRRLLDRRFLVPYLVPSTNGGFVSDNQALALVTSDASLLRDVSMLRVAVVSERPTKSSATKDWIKNVFHVDSLHCLDRTYGRHRVTDLACLAELGYGFLLEDGQCTTVQLLHVVGDYMQLQPFIEAFADVLIVDTGAKPVRGALARGLELHWCVADDDDDDNVLRDDDGILSVSLACPMSSSYAILTEYMLHETPLRNTPRVAIDRLCHDEPTSTAVPLLSEVDARTLRPERLALQQLVCQAAPLQRTLQRTIDAPSRAVASMHTLTDPLLRSFLDLLGIASSGERTRRLTELGHALTNACKANAVTAQAACSAAYHARSLTDTDDTRAAYEAAVQQATFATTGLVHLWRELAIAFVQRPSEYAALPRLAATHLVDGFPLELMDGDASVLQKAFVDAVFGQLEFALPYGARVFVLSVVGAQSSGKSTLLNTMFGVCLPTGVARCTKGVTLQLLACNLSTDYDYVLLLDTEGLQSPESVGATTAQDNRMAALALLPADATILLTKGEATSGIADLVPLALSAMATSELQHCETPRLYVVFNQVDVSQQRQLSTSVRALVETLRTGAASLAAFRPFRTAFLHGFDPEIHDATTQTGDVWCLGMAIGESVPPHDTPLPDFGHRVLQLRDHILLSKPQCGRTVRALRASFRHVARCLETSHFEMGFDTVRARVAFETLARRMQEHTKAAAEGYNKAMDAACAAIDAAVATYPRSLFFFTFGSSKSDIDHKYESLLERKIQATIKPLDAVVEALLADAAYATWSLQMQEAWAERQRRADLHAKRVVAAKVQGSFFSSQYEEELADAVKARYSDAHTSMASFDTIFDELVRQHPERYGLEADRVPALVYHAVCHSHVFTPDELVPPDVDGGSQTGSARDDEVRGAVDELIRAHVTDDINRYDEAAVLTCAAAVRQKLLALKHVTLREIQVGVSTLLSTLTTDMRRRQAHWDAVDGANLADIKSTLRATAQRICNGRGAALELTEALDEWLETHWEDACHQQVVINVALELQEAPWVESPEAMQAALDKHLLQIVRKTRYRDTVDWILRPTDHVELVTRQLVEAKVRERFESITASLVQGVHDSILCAATEASRANDQHCSRFVNALRRSLKRQLAQGGASVFYQKMPSTTNDGDDPWAFDPTTPMTGTQLYVPQRLLDRLHEVATRLRPSQGVSSAVTTAILYLEDANVLVARCGEPCPRCECPCTKASGHDDDHDTYHQPQGLVGTMDADGELIAASCAHDDSFADEFYAWAVPRENVSLPLREYIFSVAQDEILRRRWRAERCSAIPSAYYNHYLGDMEDALDLLLS
ncbi:hypothetical protein SPRG_20581 [Saprolegnia parasitica CBS 223.65]|uniref:VLIG-type G domain-containing protein n=1 Tax=Saprolegnia parasitica (strain CBS 223.65) TaxID=695850 RepID=A0A067C7P8_SAPPC|nr:hypothetical protein SPRG_20581 [Saprolegnia parasitica CBS 223.65]KDO26779.1 hypothetical protein SPRG_20581 [Saprolegnia parasitica CBS 223.65]|eukprot:XP_012202529.1 hypothetical protein SPRG_20581 [Saprolegnia parasitica CBS 223.65]